MYIKLKRPVGPSEKPQGLSKKDHSLGPPKMIHKYWNIKIIISVSPHCRATLNPSRNCHGMETTCVLRTTKQVELSPTKTKYIVKHAIQQAAPIQFS